VAFQKALQFIHYRPRSIRETYRRLLDKGFSEEVIEVIINKLIDKSLLDDFEFSRQWIENRNTFRPRSKRMLRQELRLKGVADPIIEQALEEFGGDELELAYQAGIKKAKQCQNDSKLDFRKKVGGFLGRRGYHYGIVKPTLSRLWEEFSSSAGERLSNTEKME
jgi:regulatory protein